MDHSNNGLSLWGVNKTNQRPVFTQRVYELHIPTLETTKVGRFSKQKYFYLLKNGLALIVSEVHIKAASVNLVN
jgi:hypothetical protein